MSKALSGAGWGKKTRKECFWVVEGKRFESTVGMSTWRGRK